MQAQGHFSQSLCFQFLAPNVSAATAKYLALMGPRAVPYSPAPASARSIRASFL